jgi:hypothetical protein
MLSEEHSINSFYHYGYSVVDLEKTIEIFKNELGLSKISKREIFLPYVSELVGKSGARAKIAFVELPDGKFVEILEWENSQNRNQKIEICDVGAQHICLNVTNINFWWNKIKDSNNLEMVSTSIVEVETGPNAGARVFFARIFENLFIEFFER